MNSYSCPESIKRFCYPRSCWGSASILESAEQVLHSMSFYDKEYAKPTETAYVGWTYEKGRIHESLMRLLRNRKINSALEIGIGAGELAFEVPSLSENLEFLGIDSSTVGVTKARAKLRLPRFHFVVCDARHLPLQSNKFDTVVCSEVIEHVLNPERLLAEANRALTIGGQLILTTPNPDALVYFMPRVMAKIHGRFNYKSKQPISNLMEIRKLRKMLSEAGFLVLEHSGAVIKPYTVDFVEHLLKIPLMPFRTLSESLERRRSLGCLGLYQIVLAKKVHAPCDTTLM